ncbi:ATP-binding cassette domain-containing protein, partial [Enterobacter cloacae]|uniref:ATP-binding cassette domain-containing protein n=1 Tax=Enterobacter cloacae TaxID=550 RepID=UPI001953D23B
MIRLDNISKHNGHQILFIEASMGIQKGEKVGLVGPNGAGKSSTINALTGLVAATAGRMVFDGKDITRARTEDRIRAG